MSTELLIFLTVLEIVGLVAVLAVFLVLIAARLRSIDGNLVVLGKGLEEVDRHVAAIAPTAAQINEPLTDIVGALPTIAGKAEYLAGIEPSRN
ncbi:MAG: hypothetical protein ACRDSN_03645 [Pseudonocardiaceae bacterium]